MARRPVNLLLLSSHAHSSNASVSLLHKTFGKRFHLHAGDSTQTVPPWAHAHPHKCDLVFIDGDHSTDGAMLDMINMRKATARGASVIADDISARLPLACLAWASCGTRVCASSVSCRSHAGSDPGDALETLRLAGQLKVHESYGPFDAPHKYNPCMRGPSFRSPICSAWGFAIFSYVLEPMAYKEISAMKSATRHADRHQFAMALRTKATQARMARGVGREG